MFKRNRKIRELNKRKNKIRTLLKFQLKNCIGVPYNEEGKDIVHYYTMLALNHFCKNDIMWTLDFTIKDRKS